MLWQYFRHSGQGDIKEEVPLIQEQIKKWMKKHRIKKSATLTEEEINSFLSKIDTDSLTPILLELLIVPATAIPYAARGVETMEVII